jgi:alginate O-acetyltransferase complex protein AlgI
MLFNSYLFIFVFLPPVLLGYYAAANISSKAAVLWLVAASILFYGWWDVRFLILLLISIALNFLYGLAILRTSSTPQTTILIFAIASNILLLLFFKYLFPFLGWLERFGVPNYWSGTSLVLPLGISFFTFTQIAYLVDCRAGQVRKPSFSDYLLFVTFFPHLIAGPILHHRETISQFQKPLDAESLVENLAVGAALFIFGLSKKVLIADRLAPGVSLAFENSTQLEMITAWSAALSYSMQLYFDFSGYSDMSVGLARMFAIRFPANFNSPYKSTSIIEFWRRWHMTLTRYLTVYVYNPLAVVAARRHSAQVNSPTERGVYDGRAFVAVVVAPLFVTMIIAGIWHGAGLTFLAFGLLHALYLSLNHAWRLFGPKGSPSNAWLSHLIGAQYWVITFTAVVVGEVVFRAPSISIAVDVLSAMTGLHGLDSHKPEFSRLLSGGTWTKLMVCFVCVLILPNTYQLLARYTPVLDRFRPPPSPIPEWHPGVLWGVISGALLGLALLYMWESTEFLYFQF